MPDTPTGRRSLRLLDSPSTSLSAFGMGVGVDDAREDQAELVGERGFGVAVLEHGAGARGDGEALRAAELAQGVGERLVRRRRARSRARRRSALSPRGSPR